jgi:TRAP-type C4-dicarboxylate transport system substrate-binding protein
MKRKLIISLLSLAVIVSLMSIGCAPEEAAPPEEEQEATAVEPILLKYSHEVPETHMLAIFDRYFMDEVEERTEGKVEFQRYFGGSLIPPGEEMEGMREGIADITNVNHFYYPDKTPVWQITLLPFVTGDVVALAKAATELAELSEIEAIYRDRWNAKFLWHTVGSAYHALTKEPVNSLADLQGLKLRSTGHQGVLMADIGAVPVALPSGEQYESIQRGVLDGCVYHLGGILTYHLHEQASCLTLMNMGVVAIPTYINLDTWNSLPSDVQEVMLEVAAEAPSKVGEINSDLMERYRPEFKEVGGTIGRLPDNEMSILIDKGHELVWTAWLDSLEESGLISEPQTLLDGYLESVREYETYPFPETIDASAELLR